MLTSDDSTREDAAAHALAAHGAYLAVILSSFLQHSRWNNSLFQVLFWLEPAFGEDKSTTAPFSDL